MAKELDRESKIASAIARELLDNATKYNETVIDNGLPIQLRVVAAVFAGICEIASGIIRVVIKAEEDL